MKEIKEPNPQPEKIITRRPNGTLRVQTKLSGKTRTQTQFKDDCDVNRILAKYKATGTLTHVRNAQAGVYADLTQIPSYQEALNTVINAQRAFEEVPAKIRQRFNHDPNEFIKFLADPKNNQEAVKLGLKTVPTPPPEDPIKKTLENIEKNTKPKSPKKTDPE